MTKSSEAERRRRQALILERLSDIIADDPEAAAVDICCAVLPILARAHPADKSAKNLAAIKQNYPGATRSLIEDRALAPTGVALAVVIASELARIAVDYTPGSSPRSEIAKDDTLPSDVGIAASVLATNAYKDMLASGLSAFGATAVMTITAIMEGRQAGLNGYQLCIPLLENLPRALQVEDPVDTTRLEEAALAQLCKQMGISMREARRYLEISKQNAAEKRS